MAKNYLDTIVTNIKNEDNVFIGGFGELSNFDHTLADIPLEEQTETIKAAELAVESFDVKTKNFKIRFKDLPEDQKIMIRNIRSKNIGKKV